MLWDLEFLDEKTTHKFSLQIIVKNDHNCQFDQIVLTKRLESSQVSAIHVWANDLCKERNSVFKFFNHGMVPQTMLIFKSLNVVIKEI